ncbi:DUF4974 domain-containing protein [Marinoscillum sp.]|uniref:DUF4974 domain-containing protein n=1 Tax=Marinoscillum sp. TaxID=2024838 RepID=UPI003BA9B724
MIKNSILTFLLIILLAGASFGQDMKQQVSLQATNQSLEEIFKTLSKKYDVSFSYLNNELPKNKVDVDFEGISLDHALSNLLDGFGLEHLTRSGKIIIKKVAAPLQEPEVQADSTDNTPNNLQDAEPALVMEPIDTVDEELTSIDSVKQESLATTDTLPNTSLVSVDSSDTTKYAKVQTSEPEQPIVNAPVERYNPRQGVLITYKSGNSVDEDDTNFDTSTSVQDSSEIAIETRQLQRRIGHFGLFYPFSTNSYNARDYYNNISLHLLAGYSGGLEGFEFAGVASVIHGDGKGMQLSGVTNIVNGSFTGAQIAGVTNITWYDTRGFQLAGVANVSYDRNLGAQIAGVTNVARGRESGFQGAGVANITYGRSRFGQVAGVMNSAWEVDGIQAAGLLNISSKQNGLQVSAFMNKAGKIQGAQVSGFMNKAKEVKGAQVAPFLNVAGRVHGVQIGLINISDEMHGTPIGLFCLAKRNGYYDFEMYYSDDFQANAAIKIGAPHFHNIFAFSYETDNKNRWAYGYGFGSQWGKGGVRLNTDLITYYVMEQEFPNGAFRDFELNLLSRFRFLPSLHVGSFGVFAGPTFNAMLSEHVDPESGVIGSDITPAPLWERTYRGVGRNLKFWIGYNVGVRF